MRLRTFLGIVGGVLGLGAVSTVLGVGWFGTRLVDQATERAERAARPEPDAAVWAVVEPLLLAELAERTVEDIAPDSPVRIDLERLGMAGGPDRVLVDHDRDGWWDERWMLNGGRVARRVSERDNGQYEHVHYYNGRTWSDVEPPPVAGSAGKAPDRREVDEILLGYRGKDLGTDKIKDASAGQPFKINIYQDAGEKAVSRAKVDLDRDEKADEKWDFKGAIATRHVSTHDDETYDRSFVWTDDRGWVEVPAGSSPLGGTFAAPDAAAAPSAPAAPVGRSVDTVVLSYKGKNIGTDKLKDVSKGKQFKVNVYQDAGKSTVNRVKVDLDRDDKWDEKFTFDGDGVERQVAPADDEQYTETYAWHGGTWQKK